MEKDNKKDIFMEAALEASNKDIIEDVGVESKPEEKKQQVGKDTSFDRAQVDLALESIDDGKEGWNLLGKLMEGKFASRFAKVLNEAPDKDFIKYYPKLLEHFKPKLTRNDGAADEEKDNTINIQLVQVQKDGTVRTIDISHDQIEDEDEEPWEEDKK